MLDNVPVSLICKLRRAQFIAFDNDGTLFNGIELSWSAFQKAWQTVCERHNLNVQIPSKFDFRNQIGKPAHQFFPDLLPDNLKNLSSELHSEIAKHEIASIQASEGRLFEGVLETLEILKKRGYEIILVSNASTEYFTTCVEYLGYKKYLTGYYCVGDSKKNKSEILADAIRTNGFTNGVMIGDRNSDIKAGKSNNLLTIGLTYGYGSIDELENADLLISNPLNLVHIF